MKQLLMFIFCVAISGCKKAVTPADLAYLSGYWAIEEAISPEGEKKPYFGVVEADYFELDHLTGLRKKVVPLPNGGFSVTKDAVPFLVSFSDTECMLTYTKNKHSWQEKIVALSDVKLELEDARGVVFRYQKYIP